MQDRAFHLALAALASGALAAAGAGLAVEGHDLLHHPMAWPGADGMPHAILFNLAGFIVPGLLMSAALWRVRGRLQAAGRTARIGVSLAWISALAFAALGIVPLDGSLAPGPGDRFHATAWSLWWIAFMAGAGLLALAGRDVGFLRPWLALAGIAVPLLALRGAAWLPLGLVQWLACLAWALALAAVSRRVGVQP